MSPLYLLFGLQYKLDTLVLSLKLLLLLHNNLYARQMLLNKNVSETWHDIVSLTLATYNVSIQAALPMQIAWLSGSQ